MQDYESVYSAHLKQGQRQYSANPSLIQFYQDNISRHLTEPQNILEIGCGAGSIFWEIAAGASIMGLDYSPSAVQLARTDARNLQRLAQFVCLDVREMEFDCQFDLVMDSHLLHCLTAKAERAWCLRNIHQSLRPNGLFALECMSAHKRMNFPRHQEFHTEEGVLYQHYQNGERRPVRAILDVMAIENELLTAGFKIIYLRVFSDRKIIPDMGREEALATDPDCLRVICQRPVYT